MLLVGLASAAVCGLLLGSVLRPDLREDGLLAPQTLISGGGPRLHTGDSIDPGIGRYAARIPDHVIGTDWIRPPQSAAEPQPEAPIRTVVYASADPSPAQPAAPSGRVEATPAPINYPSDDGGVYYESDLPEPPPPPEDDPY